MVARARKRVAARKASGPSGAVSARAQAVALERLHLGLGYDYDPEVVAADLVSQAEHDELAAAVLVTDSADLADRVDASVARRAAATAAAATLLLGACAGTPAALRPEAARAATVPSGYLDAPALETLASRAPLPVTVEGVPEGRLAEPLAELGAETAALDLTDETAVRGLVEDLHARGTRIDGLLHLVGGWRGGGGLAGQTEEDYRALEASFTALRHVSRALDDDLRASSAGRLAIVSSTAVTRPLAGGANYAAVKAASEAWTRAVAQGWAKAARDAEAPLRSAAVVFRVKSLAGLEERLAEEYARLWKAEAGALNDAVLTLQEKGT